jgi:hypothetical protein
MKHLALLALCILPLLAGCVTLGKQSTEARIARLTRMAAKGAMIKEPSSRIAIERAAAYMDENTGNGKIDLPLILNTIGIHKEFQSTDAQLGFLALEEAIAEIDVQSPEQLTKVAVAVRDGLKAALGR